MSEQHISCPECLSQKIQITGENFHNAVLYKYYKCSCGTEFVASFNKERQAKGLVPKENLPKSMSAAHPSPATKFEIACPYCKSKTYELNDEYSEGTRDIVKAVHCLNCQERYAITYEVKEIHGLNRIRRAA